MSFLVDHALERLSAVVVAENAHGSNLMLMAHRPDDGVYAVFLARLDMLHAVAPNYASPSDTLLLCAQINATGLDAILDWTDRDTALARLHRLPALLTTHLNKAADAPAVESERQVAAAPVIERPPMGAQLRLVSSNAEPITHA